MNVDAILKAFEHHNTDAILIGGMNFLLQHQPVVTFDVDFWVKDEPGNLIRVASALRELGAEWGPTEKEWKPVPAGHEWLLIQPVFCLTTRHGAVDIFRQVRGLEGRYDECKSRAIPSKTVNGISYLALSDEDMLSCQLALPEKERRLDRVAFLKDHLAIDP